MKSILLNNITPLLEFVVKHKLHGNIRVELYKSQDDGIVYAKVTDMNTVNAIIKSDKFTNKDTILRFLPNLIDRYDVVLIRPKYINSPDGKKLSVSYMYLNNDELEQHFYKLKNNISVDDFTAKYWETHNWKITSIY